jgi:hypothetical protein
MANFDNPHNRHLIEKFERTERNRKREAQIKYQESLGPVKTWREQELAALDRWDALWKRTPSHY